LFRLWLPGEVSDLDILKDQDLIALYQLLCCFVLEVPSLPCNLAMGFGNQLAGFVSAMPPLLLAGKGLLPLLKHLLSSTVVARMLNHLTVAERRQVRNTQVNSNILIAHRELLRRIYLTGKGDVPLIHLAFDRDGFDVPF
jgi:hypothetical protein